MNGQTVSMEDYKGNVSLYRLTINLIIFKINGM